MNIRFFAVISLVLLLVGCGVDGSNIDQDIDRGWLETEQTFVPWCGLECTWPDEPNFLECLSPRYDSNGQCELVQVDYGACYSGVGVCSGGQCVPAPGSCAPVPVQNYEVCWDDQECQQWADKRNPCVIGDCPDPGCQSCHFQPLPDGTVLPNGGGVCVGGTVCAVTM